jgi:hypothetical protein
MTFGGDYHTVGFTFFPSFVALVHKNLSCRINQIKLQYIANLRTRSIDGQKHYSTMVSDASPGTTTPKINESFVHMAHASFDCACPEDG